MATNLRCHEVVLIGAFFLGIQAGGQAAEKFSLIEDDVVAFLGGTNMVHLQQAGYLETILTRKFVSSRSKFRDLAWEADTVFQQGTVIERWRKDGWRRKGFGALDDQLKRVGTTVVIAQFGRLESMAGPDGLDEFRKAYERLIDVLSKHSRLIVLVTPTPFETPSDSLVPDLAKRNGDLALYVKSIAKIAKSRGLVFVDLFENAKANRTDNGMHMRPEVQADVAAEIARQLGATIPESKDQGRRSLRDPNAPFAERITTNLKPLRQAVIEKHRLWHDYWRPANWKLLYGDDAERQFTRGGKVDIPFKQEWMKLVPLIAKAEKRVWTIAAGGGDPGHSRPKPEVLHGDPSANIKSELASFSTSNGLQVNLFASEQEGLTSPLNIRWDPAGRMYVTVTTTYPHVFPGDVPNDKIIVLEDTNRDGRADKSTVFAEGLNIPTGIELGHGGVYVGQNTELLFLEDTDGDGKADKRRILLGGFGNGDSHQTINSFIWSPGGELYFGHGDGCESRVETPWGASHLFNAGYFRLRPRRLQLVPFLESHMGPGNPWGIAFDEWGQIFGVDGAGGVSWLSPGLVSTTHVQRLRTIGKPGGYCGIGYLDGRHLPESMHGDFVVGDFKANRVGRFSVTSEGTRCSLEWKEPILHSRHRNFRPVDVKVGPDGAIYVVDWYNPITCHQDDAYRDPKRDKAHGRIWRVSAKAPTIKPPILSDASLNEILDALTSPESWTRYQAKRALTGRDPAKVADALKYWVHHLDPKLPRYEQYLYEALGAYATIEVVEPGLLGRMLQASNPNARAYATRLVGRWHDRLERPLELLAERIVDEHPLVRMEAVVACSTIPSPRSIEVAARVVDKPMDEWISYAFKQTVHHLRPLWMPALKRGDLAFTEPNRLAAVLNETGGKAVLESLKGLVDSDELDPKSKSLAIGAILAVGGSDDLNHYGLNRRQFTRDGRYEPALHARALSQLIEAARFRDVRPAGDFAATLNSLIDHKHLELKVNAIRLAGVWNLEKTRTRVLAAASNESLPVSVRSAAFGAIAEMKLSECREILAAGAVSPNRPAIRSAAIGALVSIDLQLAATYASALFAESDAELPSAAPTLHEFLNHKSGAAALATALGGQKLKAASARHLLRSLFSNGRSDKVLLDVLNKAIGKSKRTPDFHKDYVKRLVTSARSQGNKKRGAVLFKSMACGSCHKVSGNGGEVGPDLTSIGTTLSAERIVEELLWPNRQVKEGYSVVVVVTDQGKVHTGYERRTKESLNSNVLVLHDLATRKPITIKKQHIEEKRIAGSPMPRGLTALLSKPQLLDLIQYLSELGTIQ